MQLGCTREVVVPIYKSLLPGLYAHVAEGTYLRELGVALGNLVGALLSGGEDAPKADVESALDFSSRAVQAIEEAFGKDHEALLGPLDCVKQAMLLLGVTDPGNVLQRRLSLSILHRGEAHFDTICARVEREAGRPGGVLRRGDAPADRRERRARPGGRVLLLHRAALRA